VPSRLLPSALFHLPLHPSSPLFFRSASFRPSAKRPAPSRAKTFFPFFTGWPQRPLENGGRRSHPCTKCPFFLLYLQPSVPPGFHPVRYNWLRPTLTNTDLQAFVPFPLGSSCFPTIRFYPTPGFPHVERVHTVPPSPLFLSRWNPWTPIS